MSEAKCQLCGEPMPPGEEMFNYHGYSGPCPKPPLPKPKPVYPVEGSKMHRVSPSEDRANIRIETADLRLTQALALKGLPWGVLVPYIGTLPNGVPFAIFHPEKDWDYSDFRCVFGANDGTVSEVKIKNVVRYRDGGTTDIETAVGSFHFPSVFNPHDKATFDGQVIQVEER